MSNPRVAAKGQRTAGVLQPLLEAVKDAAMGHLVSRIATRAGEACTVWLAGRWWLVVGLLVFLCACGGCEQRVPEPQPIPAADVTPLRSASATSSSARRPTAPPRPARCVVQTGDKPARPAAPSGADPSCPPDPKPNYRLRKGKVRFLSAADLVVDVEIAERHEDRMRGLMYRTQMADAAGMLFVFKERRVQSFWMKNTCLPLDMLFIDHDGLIVGIEENVPTMNVSNYGVQCPSLYVLELNAGWTRRNSVRAGQRVAFEGLRP